MQNLDTGYHIPYEYNKLERRKNKIIIFLMIIATIIVGVYLALIISFLYTVHFFLTTGL